ncbi:MAG TPA: DUF6152 family protein [Gammaproteobacteria bacterium]|nr:DUF6152 family protein [Gammaproteobacteria bacterium]
MAKGVWFALAAGCLAAAAGTASAHHSVAGQFDSGKPVQLTGVISKVDWVNPHIYIHLDVEDDKGAVTSWRLETLPTAMMRKAGLTSQMLIADGAKVTANAILARDGTQQLAWVSKLTYEDGHYYQLAGE